MVRALPQPDGACTYPCGNCSQATRVAKTQYQHRFEFVPLGGEREAQKRTRSHIQSESSRKKAWRRLQKLNSTKVAPPSLEWIPRKSVAVTPRPVQRPDRPAPTKPARQPKITVKTRPSLPSIDPELLIDREYLRAAANDARSPSSIGSQSPTSSPERVFPLISQTSLGVGRIDPFDSLPRKGSWTTQRLLYHCKPPVLHDCFLSTETFFGNCDHELPRHCSAHSCTHGRQASMLLSLREILLQFAHACLVLLSAWSRFCPSAVLQTLFDVI